MANSSTLKTQCSLNSLIQHGPVTTHPAMDHIGSCERNCLTRRTSPPIHCAVRHCALPEKPLSTCRTTKVRSHQLGRRKSAAALPDSDVHEGLVSGGHLYLIPCSERIHTFLRPSGRRCRRTPGLSLAGNSWTRCRLVVPLSVISTSPARLRHLADGCEFTRMTPIWCENHRDGGDPE